VAWKILSKTVNGNQYFYAKSTGKRQANESAEEKYLGSADDIVAIIDAFHNPPAPEVNDREFGAVAALWSVAERLNVVPELDSIFPKRNNGPSIGTYLLVGAISRCLEPLSKRAIPDWYQKTILPRLTGYEAKLFSSQRYWDNCHDLAAEDLEKAQLAIARNAVDEYDLYTGRMLYDATNYDTYLDTENPSELAQRGHAKSKRNDLKIVGLAALVTADGHVPMFYDTYSGNRHDSVEFGDILPKLSKNIEQLFHHQPDITMILDKGNNSKDNWELWKGGPFHFVGALPVSDYPDLLEIPLSDYDQLGEEAPELRDCLGYRTTQKALGNEYELVVTYNPELYEGQCQGIERNIAQCQKEFDGLQAKLVCWHNGEVNKGRKPNMNNVKEQVKRIVSRQYMKDLWKIESAEENGLPKLSVQFDQDAFRKMKDTLLGKSIIFTDRFEWTTAEIVSAYRSQWKIEQMFRCSKDRKRNSWEPVYHWTDPMIRVHTFCCMLGLTLTSLLLRELNQNDFYLSQRTMFEHLEGIRETEITYPAVGRFSALKQTLFHQLTGIQQGLFHQLRLNHYMVQPISSSRRPPSCASGKRTKS
jgi:transposase